MKQQDFKHLVQERNDMKIILEFPKKPRNEENIIREVKNLLTSILQENLTSIF